MLESVLVKIGLALVEKLGRWLKLDISEAIKKRRNHARISESVDELVKAESKDNVRSAVDDIM